MSFNVLITSAGRRVKLVNLFKDSFKTLEIEGKVIASDMSEIAPALFFADKALKTLHISHKDYIDNLIDFSKKEKIKLIIPTIDTELEVLSKNLELFESIGVQVIVSSQEIIETFSSKEKTNIFFTDKKIPTPSQYLISNLSEKDDSLFPLIIKPSMGSSSHGVTKINNFKELSFFKNYIKDPVVQEFVDGDEYTIDVLVNFKGEMICAVPRRRIEVRAGEVSKSVTVLDNEIINYCDRIIKHCNGMVGCVTIQCIRKVSGELKFIEINPRFGGGYPLTASAGANYPLLILMMALKRKIHYKDHLSWKENVVMLRYDEHICISSDAVSF